jgi:hypothetical protein
VPSLGRTSRERLRTLHPQLRDLVLRVVRCTPCVILAGHRDEDTQELMVLDRRTTVRWPDSPYNQLPSIAVSLAPVPMPSDLLSDTERRIKFHELAAIVGHEARAIGLDIEWGADGIGGTATTDQLTHYQLAVKSSSNQSEPLCLPSSS